ncbi:outer kinetochore KNL1 complex subunit KNL1 [Mustelus asterias]
MDENYPVFPEANVENGEGKCKRRQSGILKVSRSPLRTLKEAEVTQKMEQVGKLRRSSRRVSFAETKEVKEFVTDKMMMIMQDVENGKDCQKENQQNELERDVMPLNPNFSIAGMDALLHAPLRTPLQQFEVTQRKSLDPCDHIETVNKHQIFPNSGIQVQREDPDESSETEVASKLPKKIDFKSFLTGFDSTEPMYTNVCFHTGEEGANKSFNSIRQNEVHKQQKTIDFKMFLNSIKQSDKNENKMVSMSSIFEEQVLKQAGFDVPSACTAVEDVEITNDILLQINSNKNQDPNRTVLFRDQDDDMEFTKSHTISINHFALGNTTTSHSLTVPKNVERLCTERSTHSSFLQDKTIVFSGEDYMDMTRSHTVPIDVGEVEHLTNQNQLTAVAIQKTDRPELPSTPNEHTLFSDNGYCTKINRSEALNASKLTSRSVSNLSSLSSDKTVVFSEANDMDITKSHAVTIDSGNHGQVANKTLASTKLTSRRSIVGSIQSAFPTENTVVFSDANDMDITKSHTVAIDNVSLGQVKNETMAFTRMPYKLGVPGSMQSFHSDKTKVFSEANDMDVTKSHSVAINSGNLGQVTNETFSLMKLTSIGSTDGSTSLSFPTDKTMVFSEANDMDITKSHTVPIDSGNLGSVVIRTVGSRTSFPSDKTTIFSEADDMDITKSHTVAIESENLRSVANHTVDLDKKSSIVDIVGSVPSSFPSDKIPVFSEANDMDITKSHTVAIDSENLGSVVTWTVGSRTSFPSDKTTVFSEANDMDITRSHTVAIESGNLGQITNKMKDSMKQTSIESTARSVLSSFPGDKTTVLTEASDRGITKSYTVTIPSKSVAQFTNEALSFTRMTSKFNVPRSMLPSFSSDKTVVFSEANDMDITKSHTVTINSGNLGQVTNETFGLKKLTSIGSTDGSTSLSFPTDKTMVFSEANDMDITKSHTVPIDSGNLGSIVTWTVGSRASFPSDKTTVFSEADDMDITKSHTVAIESENLRSVANHTVDLDKKSSILNTARSIPSSFPSDKTLVFSEANDMDITRSHTVAIESGNLGQITNESKGSMKPTSIESTASLVLSSFPGDKTTVLTEANDRGITKSYTVTIPSKSVAQFTNEALGFTRMTSKLNVPRSILPSFSSDKTVVFSEANDMDITKSHTVAIESENIRPDANCTIDSNRMTSRQSIAGSTLSYFRGDKTLVFSEANDMDITKSHTVPIDSESLGKFTNEAFGSTGMIPRLTDVGFSRLSFPRDKTMVFSEANDMDITKSHTVAIESGNIRPDANPTMDSNKVTSRRSIARSMLSSFPSESALVFAEANDMDIIKSHTIAVKSNSLGLATNKSLGSDKAASKFGAPGSVLSSLPKGKIQISEQVTPVTKIDTVPVCNKHDVSSIHKISQLVPEKGKNCFGNHSGNVEFANIQNTVENTICNVNCAVRTFGPDSDPSTQCMESATLNMDGGTKQEGESVSSTCITEVHEKMNGKGIKKYVLRTEDFLDSNLKAQAKRSLVVQGIEAGSEEFVRHKVSDAQSEGTVNIATTESKSTANKELEHNQSRKSSLANMPSLQKLNSMTNVLEGLPVDDEGPANCQTRDAKVQFSKQNSLVRDIFKYKISLGIFPPKLSSKENLYKAENSNHQDVKTSGEHLCSSSLLNVMYKSNKLEGDSNLFEPNVDPKKSLDIQIESQMADHDQIENKMFDQMESSHCLKSSNVPCLTIPEQLGKESSPEPHENVTGCQDQVLGDSKMIKSVEQRLYQKRAWSEEEENENVCSKRKMRNLGPEDTKSSRQKAGAPVVQWEILEHKSMEETLPSMTTKSMDSNSSLDSTKGDGTSAIAITPKCNLNTSLVIIEESELHEKLMDGQITVREFFKLLKVQTHAQKSRQSELQVNIELDKSSAFENWLAVKFVHRPKREAYEEDSSALSAAIAELKDQLLDLDKLLSEINFPLWKNVMQMTEEELQQFRSCLNAKKSTFVKRTKMICHEQKVKLYSAQLNMLKAQRQLRNEYENSLDDMLHKMDDCLASLDLANLDHLGECSADVIDNDENMMQLEQTVANRREELKKHQAEHSDMERLLEWTLFLYQDEQAVYQFLYESLELTLKFGEPECGGVSLGEKCRKILDMNLESLLDEDEAPLHSKLVHDLIMTYWKSPGSWHNVYRNESQLPMLLLDVSIAVSRYRLLGDELEYFLNWGSKFGILKTEIQPTDVKYLFTSYDALSKFELTFHLKPSYPWSPLQFTFNSWFGNISGEHINEVLLTVKPGPKYLTRIVKSLFRMLLIIPGAHRFQLQHSSY